MGVVCVMMVDQFLQCARCSWIKGRVWIHWRPKGMLNILGYRVLQDLAYLEIQKAWSIDLTKSNGEERGERVLLESHKRLTRNDNSLFIGSI